MSSLIDTGERPPAERFRELVRAHGAADGIVRLGEERQLLQAGTLRYGLRLEEARGLLLADSAERRLRLQSQLETEVAQFLESVAGDVRRISRADFDRAVAFYRSRAGSGLATGELRHRVRTLAERAAIQPKPSGWLWRSRRWFHGIPAVAEPRIAELPPAAVTTAAVGDGRASEADRQAVRAALDAWMSAVSSNAPDVVDRLARLYDPGALLLATVSPRILDTPAGIRQYFVDFTAKQNLRAEINTLYLWVEPRKAAASGLYTFRWTTANGTATALPARFTFVYSRVGNQWLIVNHHSSDMPEAAAPPMG